MTETGGAVFLSYASQDAEAAQRIHDALREAGVEVWFDRSELRGGDAWDASIRRQIRACALVVPVISANTQHRTEGYFRLEWRLAEQRSHLMARGRPFLVPVVVDDTVEAGAHVPDAFLEVQWTRLPGGRCDAAFAARVRQLLAGGFAAPVREERPRPAAPSAAPSVAPPAPPPAAPWVASATTVRPDARRRWFAVAAVAGLAALAVAMVIIERTRPASAGSSPAAAATSPGSAAERAARARELLDGDPLRTRRNVELAEQFALEAIAKDPSSAAAFAAAAWANFRFIAANYEDTPQRRADLRTYAEKSALLDPGSVEAQLALCGLHRVNRDWAETNRCLDALMARKPGNLTVLREAAWASMQIAADAGSASPVSERTAAILERLRAASTLGRSHADTTLAAAYWRRGEYVEADRWLDGVFASGQPTRDAYLVRLLVLLYGWGDLEAARGFAATIPPKLLLEDVFIYHVTQLWLRSGDYDKALETLGRSQRDMLQEALVAAPTAMLRGYTHAIAGRPAAAELQWREALKTVDRRLEAEPDSDDLRGQKAVLLALLGEREAAAEQYELSRELRGSPAPGSVQWALDYQYHLAAGDRDGAIVRLERLMQPDYGRWPAIYTFLRDDPQARPLHGDPRVQAMLEQGRLRLDELRSGTGASSPG